MAWTGSVTVTVIPFIISLRCKHKLALDGLVCGMLCGFRLWLIVLVMQIRAVITTNAETRITVHRADTARALLYVPCFPLFLCVFVLTARPTCSSAFSCPNRFQIYENLSQIYRPSIENLPVV